MTGARASSAAVVPVIAAGAAATLLYLVQYGYRADYAGHMLAGYGGTLLALGVLVLVAARAGAWPVLAVTVAAIAAGALLEATIFRIAIFDPVDFANQSLGACVAGAGAMGHRGRLAGGAYAVAGAAALAVGFYLAFAA